jgi:SAM-dependent methyltransferase
MGYPFATGIVSMRAARRRTLTNEYVHGYSDREGTRLSDQANTLADLLHGDTAYPAGSRVLEAGCGTGAQTVLLARNSPQAVITSIDISHPSLLAARQQIRKTGITNVRFQQADVFHLPFRDKSFDHVFFCFLLEHMNRPVEVLRRARSMLREGGSLTVIEGDHGSALFHPESPAARKTIQFLVDIQAELGGNALIGRQLFPLLREAGFRSVSVSPRQVYADSSQPDWAEGFTRNTFNAMVEGVRGQALARGLITVTEWDRGIADLYATAGPDGTFCYTFFKATAVA